MSIAVEDFIAAFKELKMSGKTAKDFMDESQYLFKWVESSIILPGDIKDGGDDS